MPKRRYFEFDGPAYRRTPKLSRRLERIVEASALEAMLATLQRLSDQHCIHPLHALEALVVADNRLECWAQDELERQTGVYVGGHTTTDAKGKRTVHSANQKDINPDNPPAIMARALWDRRNSLKAPNKSETSYALEISEQYNLHSAFVLTLIGFYDRDYSVAEAWRNQAPHLSVTVMKEVMAKRTAQRRMAEFIIARKQHPIPKKA